MLGFVFIAEANLDWVVECEVSATARWKIGSEIQLIAARSEVHLSLSSYQAGIEDKCSAFHNTGQTAVSHCASILQWWLHSDSLTAAIMLRSSGSQPFTLDRSDFLHTVTPLLDIHY